MPLCPRRCLRSLETSMYFAQLLIFKGLVFPDRSRDLSTQEKGREPGLCFQGFGTKDSALKYPHNALAIEPLLNGSSFSPRGLTDACRVLRSQGSAGSSLCAHPGVALPFRTREGWLVLPGTEAGG